VFLSKETCFIYTVGYVNVELTGTILQLMPVQHFSDLQIYSMKHIHLVLGDTRQHLSTKFGKMLKSEIINEKHEMLKRKH
jgi:hypothetical protein